MSFISDQGRKRSNFDEYQIFWKDAFKRSFKVTQGRKSEPLKRDHSKVKKIFIDVYLIAIHKILSIII